MNFTPGDLVRIALPPPSITDPVGEVVAVTAPGAANPGVVVRWSSGREVRYHPSALEPVAR